MKDRLIKNEGLKRLRFEGTYLIRKIGAKVVCYCVKVWIGAQEIFTLTGNGVLIGAKHQNENFRQKFYQMNGSELLRLWRFI
jgi:hypothetical protein